VGTCAFRAGAATARCSLGVGTYDGHGWLSQHRLAHARGAFATLKIVRIVARNLLDLFLVPYLVLTAAQQDRPREWGWPMNHPGLFRSRWDCGSLVFSEGVRRRGLVVSTDRRPAFRLAGFVSSVDPTPAARR
jgi:hypothetical protein